MQATTYRCVPSHAVRLVSETTRTSFTASTSPSVGRCRNNHDDTHTLPKSGCHVARKPSETKRKPRHREGLGWALVFDASSTLQYFLHTSRLSPNFRFRFQISSSTFLSHLFSPFTCQFFSYPESHQKKRLYKAGPGSDPVPSVYGYMDTVHIGIGWFDDESTKDTCYM
jgi:hypothetical protein